MKKNNPRKPFFNSENQDSDSSQFKKKSEFSSKKTGKGDFQKKSFDKQERKFDSRPDFGDKPKGRFFKGEEKSSPFNKEEKRPTRGGKFEKDFDFGERKQSGKKSFSPKSDRPKREDFSGKKFDRRNEEPEKPFRKNFSQEGPERKVYKGRGKDEKPRFEIKRGENFSEKGEVKRGFGKNRPRKQELNPERPEYNFSDIPGKKSQDAGEDGQIRLNKYISNSGICSRREADDLIAKGMVTVNGEVVTELGRKVKKTDRVIFQGKRINPEKPVYVLLNKPKDFITTTNDPMERKTVMNLVANACEERIFPVGRLDRNTTGLLLFTNDGELAAKLSHPSNQIKKIYQVTLDKPLTHKDEEQILEGLTLEDGDVKVDDMQVLSKDRTILGLEIHIGRNRIVRRLFAHLGYEVTALDRVMFAGLDKKDLKRGNYRFLTEKEVIRLKYYL
ncbi:pseudouridine synthase [Algoriphagus sp. oki45]|uniref:pseudouridine synthase n=1 Tax=Algoriphagus sp. oki45 TaxID=3067294 RepID=UPI0027F66BC8|nr:pseudouridine synthase [Algoriphagus sp. oki45]